MKVHIYIYVCVVKSLCRTKLKEMWNSHVYVKIGRKFDVLVWCVLINRFFYSYESSNFALEPNLSILVLRGKMDIITHTLHLTNQPPLPFHSRYPHTFTSASFSFFPYIKSSTNLASISISGKFPPLATHLFARNHLIQGKFIEKSPKFSDFHQ